MPRARAGRAALAGGATRTVPTAQTGPVPDVGTADPPASPPPHRTGLPSGYSWFQAFQRLAYSPPRATSSSWVPSSTIRPSMTTATRSASAAV